jgi:hypothetical protein
MQLHADEAGLRLESTEDIFHGAGLGSRWPHRVPPAIEKFLTMSVNAASLRLEEIKENVKMKTVAQRCVALGVLALVAGSVGCAGSTGTDAEQVDGEQVGTESSALTAGSLDTTFNRTGKLEVNTQGGESYTDVKIDSSGRLVAVGAIQHNVQSTPPRGMNLKVARVLPNGTMDTTFATNGVFSYTMNDESIAYSSAILPNGNILVAGQTTKYGTTTIPSASWAFVLQLDPTGHLVRVQIRPWRQLIVTVESPIHWWHQMIVTVQSARHGVG